MKVIEKTVVEFAYEIVAMHNELLRLRDENKSLKMDVEKHNKFVNDGIKHNNKMMGNLLKATMTMNEEQIQMAYGNDEA